MRTCENQPLMRPEEALSLEMMRRMAGAFDKFVDEWYDQMDHHQDDLLRRARGEPILEEYFGGPDGAGKLGKDLDEVSGQALSRYRALAPHVTPKEEALFCYMAMGMDNELIRRLLRLEKKSTASLRKTRLADKVEQLKPPHREEFLALIGRPKKR